jgi:two-component sensor histidine kinase
LNINDNGIGLNAGTSVKQHQSLATTIIRERIDLLNKTSREKIELTIDRNKHGNGTHVEMKLPIYS